MRLLSLLPRILAIFLIALPPLIAIRQPALMQGCDFVMTFYPVGAMVAGGQASNIYPPPGATSFINAPFNLFAHSLLASLPKNYVAIYMYPPLVAAIFAPLSKLPPTAALVLWQILSVLSLVLIAALFAQRKRAKLLDYFFMMALFCPIFHTLLIGHLGIIMGLLPLALGYFLLLQKKEIAAGCVWGFLGLKPQFLPAVMLVAGALLLCKRPKAAIGLILGLTAFVASSCAALGPDIFISWLSSFKLSDTIFANPSYGFPEYMVVSLPAVLMQCFPHDARVMAKLPIYAIAGAVGLYSLWRCTRLLQATAIHDQRSLSLVMTIGLFVLPLVLPHFLFYDMCGLALFCIIAYSSHFNQADGRVMIIVRRLMWWVCNIYYCSFMFLTVAPLKQWFALPLVLFFAFLYWRVLKLFSPPPAISAEAPAGN